MPLYQYQCRECGHDLEARQKFSDDPLKVCPNCGAEQGLYRVVQAAGIVFKGSGFYVTDSRGDRQNLTTPAKKKEDGTSSSTSDSAASTAASTEKSESKTTSSSTPSTSTSTPT